MSRISSQEVSAGRMQTGHAFQFGQRVYDLFARTHIMGVLNVTPDSFSDGGRYLEPGAAVDHALRMIDEGVDIIDIGGESTRPKGTAYGGGAEPVSDADEAARVLPVIAKLGAITDVPISIDTTKASVARRALDAGAVIVNDISGFTFDPEMPATVGSMNASAIAMHIRGTPLTMQQNPVYADLIGEVRAYLLAAIEKGRAAGIRQMIVDPGIGFGKTVDHNLRLLKGLGNFKDLGCPILVGPSRKSFIGAVLDLPVGERLEGTLAACAVAILGGANLLRVHDVKEARRVALMVDAIRLAEV